MAAACFAASSAGWREEAPAIYELTTKVVKGKEHLLWSAHASLSLMTNH
jgi:hypothetical protein